MALPSLLRLMYRNIRVNIDPGTLVILLGLPALYLVFFGFGFQSITSGGGSSTSYLAFLTPGILAFQAVIAGTVGGSMLWADRRFGMLAQILSQPFTRLQYLFGIMLTGVLFSLGGAAVMLGIAFALLRGGPTTPLALGLIFGAIALGAIFFGALMLLVSALVKSNTAYNSIQILLIFVINFASTVFYPEGTGLPAVLRGLFNANPLTYVANAVRGAYLGSVTSGDLTLLLLLLAETLTLLYLATRAYYRSDVSYE